jgi:hypothetical protein
MSMTSFALPEAQAEAVVRPQRGPDERVWTVNQGQEGTSKLSLPLGGLFRLMGLDGLSVESSMDVDFRHRLGRLYDQLEG